jgi:hypothetical protein
VCSLGLSSPHADTIDDDAVSGGSCSLTQINALDSELGSVGFMKNIAEHPESIRAVANRLLSKAVKIPEFKNNRNCDVDCLGTLQSQIVYKVEPTVFLAKDKQQALCFQLEEQTLAQPMHFGDKDFDSIDKLNDWLMDFSQGRGEDGKQLYEQCGSNCSPRYTFRISQDGGKYRVGADVLCGFARDKTTDLYAVSTAIRWHCREN